MTEILRGSVMRLAAIASLAIAVMALTCLPMAHARAQSELPTTVPADSEPLTGDEIRALLGGGTNFNFVAVKAPIAGTGYWDLATGTAYGAFQIADSIKGNWGFPWFIDGNKNCLEYSSAQTVCTHIHAHGDGGFMEVNLDGAVHTVYTPVMAQPLPVPLSEDAAKALLSQFLIWNQEPEFDVSDVRTEGDNLVAAFVTQDGAPAWTLVIDRTTGQSRVTPSR